MTPTVITFCLARMVSGCGACLNLHEKKHGKKAVYKTRLRDFQIVSNYTNMQSISISYIYL